MVVFLCDFFVVPSFFTGSSCWGVVPEERPVRRFKALRKVSRSGAASKGVVSSSAAVPSSSCPPNGGFSIIINYI